MNRAKWKQNAKVSIRKNYWRCFVACFIVTLLIGGTIMTTIRETNQVHLSNDILNSLDGKSNSDIVNEFISGVKMTSISITQTNGVIGNILNNISKSNSFLFGMLNVFNQFFFQDRVVAGIIIAMGVLISFLYYVFVSKVLEVGRICFFLENRMYSKTKVSRIILPYRVRRSIKVSLAMFRKSVYQFLWIFTIIGGPIKFYSYKMVPYLLAENPDLSGKEAISLSNQMMKNHRMEAFFLDLSFLGNFIIGLLTLNLFNLFYTNLYYEATYAEYYMYLRGFYKDQFPKLDIYLENNEEHFLTYPSQKYFLKEHESRNIFKRLDYNQKYDVLSYILFFFSFSFLGWIWEVGLTCLVKECL